MMFTKRMVQPRSEVDDLHTELTLRKEEHKQRMKYLYSQGDTEAKIRRQKTEMAGLQKSLEQAKEFARAATSADEFRPVVADAIASLGQDIAAGLPFK